MCRQCGDIFNLRYDMKHCSCKNVSGFYKSDGITAEVYMPSRFHGSVLGFANNTLNRAIADQHKFGDSTEKMSYAGQCVTKGRDFVAFVIPEVVDSVIYHYSE